MKRIILSTIVCLSLGVLLTACSRTQGSAIIDENAQIPSTSSPVTDVGNPVEEPSMPKAMYVNERYSVSVEYPSAWSLEEPNPAEADFSTNDGVDFTISFVDLEEGETFESFLTELRGGFDDLHEMVTSEFDRAMNKFDLTIQNGKKFFDVERYYLQDQAPHRFVMIQKGLIDAEIVTSKMKPEVMHGTIEFEKTKLRAPHLPVLPKP